MMNNGINLDRRTSKTASDHKFLGADTLCNTKNKSLDHLAACEMLQNEILDFQSIYDQNKPSRYPFQGRK